MEGTTEHPVRRWLRTASPVWSTLYASLSAFCLYTCVYAFRKTFAAATFESLGIGFKEWMVISQVIGYALSKFIGIKVISEIAAGSRTLGILIMVTIAGISWLLFGLVPKPYNLIFLFT